VITAADVVEEKGWTGPLHDTVGDLGDLELGAYGLAYVHELALLS
jgi:hypothetical protein